MTIFSATQYRGQNESPLRSLKIEYTAHRYITCNLSRKVSAPRPFKRKRAIKLTLCYLSAGKEAMTVIRDNDTSVIRSRSTMKGRG